VWSGGLNDAGQLGHSPDAESIAVRLGTSACAANKCAAAETYKEGLLHASCL
jgi:hypothetical protein